MTVVLKRSATAFSDPPSRTKVILNSGHVRATAVARASATSGFQWRGQRRFRIIAAGFSPAGRQQMKGQSMPLSSADKLEIQELIARYNHAVDSGDTAAYAATFTEDGSFRGGHDLVQGRENLAEMAGWAGGNRHWTANHIINGDGDAATLKCYLMVTRTKEARRSTPRAYTRMN